MNVPYRPLILQLSSDHNLIFHLFLETTLVSSVKSTNNSMGYYLIHKSTSQQDSSSPSLRCSGCAAARHSSQSGLLGDHCVHP
ncbi:hypothetical protein NPIL_646011 [Nephila pilipes]|uniref:Uncharacterized protein n=1 Tax=Nephila pilipes TaxID=299642 RepID=A0A8X6NVG8_NEPPI|nr:hypothetical protein NPIL_646011 [Nephila pilipes]